MLSTFIRSVKKVYLLSSITHITYRKEQDSFTNHGTDVDSLSLYWTIKMKEYIKPEVIYCICAPFFCYFFQRKSACSAVSASNISNCWWCCCISAFKSIKDNLLLKLPGHVIFNKSQILFRDYNKKTLCLIINFIFILAKHPPLDRLPCFVKKNQHSGNEVLVLLCGHSKEYVEVM